MKKRAFKEGDQAERKRVQGELKTMLKEAKESYRRKVEQKLQENNIREVWDGMKTITGCKKSSGTVQGDVVRANQINHFYNRFEPGVNDYLTPIPAPPPPPSAPSAAVTCPLHATTPSPSHPRDQPLPPALTTASVAPLPPASSPLPFSTAAPVSQATTQSSCMFMNTVQDYCKGCMK